MAAIETLDAPCPAEHHGEPPPPVPDPLGAVQRDLQGPETGEKSPSSDSPAKLWNPGDKLNLTNCIINKVGWCATHKLQTRKIISTKSRWDKKRDGTWGWVRRRKTTFTCRGEDLDSTTVQRTDEPVTSTLSSTDLVLAGPGTVFQQGGCTVDRPYSTQQTQAEGLFLAGKSSSTMTAMKTDVAGIKETGSTSLGKKRELSMCEVTGGDRQSPVTSVPPTREVTDNKITVLNLRPGRNTL